MKEHLISVMDIVQLVFFNLTPLKNLISIVKHKRFETFDKTNQLQAQVKVTRHVLHQNRCLATSKL